MSRPPLRYRIADWFAARGRQLGDAWDRLIGPIENAFRRVGEGSLSALDSFEGIESLVVRLVRAVFWPLIALAGLIGRFLPSGTTNGPFGFVGRFAGRLGSAIYRLAERLNLDGALLLIAKLLTPFWWPIAALLGFGNAWLATRRPRELLLAAPAVAFMVPFAFVAVQGAMLGKRDIAERYKIAVREAAESGDYSKVDLYERKLAQLGIDTRRSDFRTAQVLADDGDFAAAYERMKRLAPAGSAGYAPAHVWIAQRLITGEINDQHDPQLGDKKEALRLAEQHLDQLDTLGVSNDSLVQMRAYIFALTGREKQAIDLLEPYSRDPGPAATMRLRLLAQTRSIESARSQARVVLEMTADRRWREAATADGFEAWALAAELLGNDDQLESSLSAWMSKHPDDEKPRRLLATYRSREATELLATPTAAPAKTAEVLLDAVRLGAPKSWTGATFARLAEERSGSRYLRLVWNALMETPDAPEGVVLIMATSAAAEGDILAARNAFKRLVDQESQSAVVWNNYAWTLLQDPEPDAAGALAAVDRALELRPNDFRYRETRGQAFLALERWDDAISDLEYALNGLPEAPEVHRSLAIAYEATSKPQLAEIHRRQAGL